MHERGGFDQEFRFRQRNESLTMEDLERLGEAADTLEIEATGEARSLRADADDLPEPSSGLGGARRQSRASRSSHRPFPSSPPFRAGRRP